MLPEGLSVTVEQRSKEMVKGLLEGVPTEMSYSGYILTRGIGSGTDDPLVDFPIMTVNPAAPQEEHESIAYVDSRRPEVIDAGGKALADFAEKIILARKPDFVLAADAPTLKAGGLKREAVEHLKRRFYGQPVQIECQGPHL